MAWLTGHDKDHAEQDAKHKNKKTVVHVTTIPNPLSLTPKYYIST